MTSRLMISVSALVLGAALATTAAAQVATDNTSADNGSHSTVTATDSSTKDSNNPDSSQKFSNNTTTLTDNGNDKSTNTTTTTKTKTLTDVGNDKSVNTTTNTTTKTKTTTITASLSLQDLAGTVTGNTINGGSGTTDTLHPTGGGIITGDITADGASYSNFAGVQTANNNTGLQSINQAATGLAANANISFGAAP